MSGWEQLVHPNGPYTLNSEHGTNVSRTRPNITELAFVWQDVVISAVRNVNYIIVGIGKHFLISISKRWIEHYDVPSHVVTCDSGSLLV